MKSEKDSVIAIITISVIVDLCLFLTLGLWLVSLTNDSYYYNSYYGYYYESYNGIDYYWSFISFIVFSFLYFFLSFVFGILILAKDWKNNKINQGSVKILWGVFSLILLGLTASFIFGLIALHYYKEANRKPQYSYNNNYYQDPNNMYPNPNIPNNNLNKYDKIQKIYDLYKNGAITEEEYLKMKKDILDH